MNIAKAQLMRLLAGYRLYLMEQSKLFPRNSDSYHRTRADADDCQNLIGNMENGKLQVQLHRLAKGQYND